MFIVKKVRFKNFRSYGNQFTEVILDKSPSTVISAPNGCGKSSILMAIEFGLFGKVSNGINKGDLVNTVNNKDCLVEIECEQHGKDIKIRRGLKPNIFEIFINGKLIDQEASSRDYQSLFEEEVLGFNINSFRQIVSINGSSYTPFLLLSAGNRRKIVEELLNLTIFSKMNLIHLGNIARNKEEVSGTEAEILRLESSLESLKKGLRNVDLQEEGYRKSIEENIQKTEERIQKIQNEIQESIARIDALQPSIQKQKRLNKKRNELKDIRKDIEKKIKKIDSMVSFFLDNDTCPTCSQPIGEEYKKDIQEPKLAKKEELGKSLIELDKMVESTEKHLEGLESVLAEIRDLEMKIHTDNKRIVDLQKYVKDQERLLTQKTGNREDLEKDISSTANNLTFQNQKRLELLEEKQYNDIISAIIKDNGIKSRIILQYVPRMNQEINRYLQLLNLNLNFQIDENFHEKILSRFKDELSYSSFSAGERARIDIAILFTWRELAKLKNSVSCNLLFLDEIFDSVLDEEGLDAFVNLLKHHLPKSNVFIISHRPEIQDKLESNLRIVKAGNFSYIEGSRKDG